MIRFYKFKDGKLLEHQHSRPKKRCTIVFEKGRRCANFRTAKGSNICKFCWEDAWEVAHPFIGSLEDF